MVEDVETGGSLGSSDREMVEFRILCGQSRAISRITALDFRRANFGLFKNLLGGIPWVRACSGLAAAVNKSATRPPLPPPGCGGEWKETAENWWVGIRAV